MIAGGLRRLAVIVVATAGATAVGSLALGAIAGFSARRSLPVGFEVVGAFCVVVGFFFGNRGPVRLKGDGAAPIFGARLVRWATPEERTASLADSAVFVLLGIVLVLIGIAADGRRGLW